MTSIDILVIGHLERGADGSVVPSGTWSTSSLVRTDDGHNIVVDTSQGYMGAGIRSSFKQIGRIFPEDVDTVVLTHGHPDHIDGVTLLDTEKEIAKGVRFVRTPGHTEDSGSLFVDADRRYALVGDAVPLQENLEKKAVPALNCDPDEAMASMKRIVQYADVVVPGHGKPFGISALKRLYK